MGVGSGDALGDGSAVDEGVGVGVGSAVGSGVGLADGSGVGETVGAAEDGGGVDGVGLMTTSGDAETTELGRGVAVVVGSAVWTAGTEMVGVDTGGSVARGNERRKLRTTCDAAKTKAPPSRATDMIVTISVPVVRIAPRMTCVRRSDSHERCERRRVRSSKAATQDALIEVWRGMRHVQRAEEAQDAGAAADLDGACGAALDVRRQAGGVGASSSSSRNASMSARARVQSRAWPTCGFVTTHT